ncbi:hypothetical protein HZB88_04020 [archaeon]|nr:hypothetical protein [archaeon]
MPLPLYLDINDVCSGIRKLILLMNDIPFVETISSWEGGPKFYYRRYRERYGARIFLRERHGIWVFKNGYVTFQTDTRFPQHTQFLEKVGELSERYPFSALRQQKPIREDDYAPRGRPYGFKFPLGIGLKHSFRLHGKDIAYGDLDSARKRKGEFDDVWKNFEELCREFI